MIPKSARVLVLLAWTATFSLPLQADTRARVLTTDTAELRAVVSTAHDRFKRLREGKNADYIPVLAQVDSNLFGVAMVTTSGQRAEAGDADTNFAIESISKVFTLATAMQEHGEEVVLSKIGVDATGEKFNSIDA